MVTSCRLTGFGATLKVPRLPHLVEVAQVKLTGLHQFEDVTALHVVYGGAQWIQRFCLLVRVHVVTGHCVLFAPLFKAIFDLLVLPHTKAYIPEVCKGSAAHPPFLLCVSAFDFWQQAGLRSARISLTGCLTGWWVSFSHLLIQCWCCRCSCLNHHLTLQIHCQSPRPCCWTHTMSPHAESLNFFLPPESLPVSVPASDSVSLSSSLSDSESMCDCFWGDSEESLEEELD